MHTLATADDTESDDETDDDENDHDDDVEIADCLLLPETLSYRRLGCLAHIIHLVIKRVYKSNYQIVLSKARKLVARIRKSFVTVEKLVEKFGKTVISDNTTRWNSTYYMVQRLLLMKGPKNEVLSDMNTDSLLASEWLKMEEMTRLLEPFAKVTDILQTDALFLSYIIPSLVDLQVHLK